MLIILFSSVLVINLLSFTKAGTINIYLEVKNQTATCDSDKEIDLAKDHDIIFSVTSSYFVNGVRCIQENGKTSNSTSIRQTDHYDFSHDIKNNIYTKNIGVATESVKGEWRYIFLIQRNSSAGNTPILIIDGVYFTAPVCVIKVNLLYNSNKWTYIGVGIGILVTTVMILQTAAVLYFKKKAQIAVMHRRLQNLSTKNENDLGGDQARYKRLLPTPVAIPRPESVESDEIYDTIDEFKAKMAAEKDKGMSTRPPLPLPDEDTYEDMNMALAAAGHVIPPLVAPPVDTLPRKPKLPQPSPTTMTPSIPPTLATQSSPCPKQKKNLTQLNPPVLPKHETTAKPSNIQRSYSKKNAKNTLTIEESKPMVTELDLVLKKRRETALSTSKSPKPSEAPISFPPSKLKPKPPLADNAPLKPNIENAPITSHTSNALLKPNVANAPMTLQTNAPIKALQSSNEPQPPYKQKPLPSLPPLAKPKPPIPAPPGNEYSEEEYYDSGEWDPEYLAPAHIYNI